jgi:alkylhydroperoxidase/carboxymuconolactone decarboxylase family protein YurZ
VIEAAEPLYVAVLSAALIVMGRAAKMMLVAEDEIAVKLESAAFVAVTEQVSALVTVRESVFVMEQPAVPGE